MKLNEVVVVYHDNLNPKLWTEDAVLKDDVREALVNLAKAFIEFLEIDNSFIKDVVITGSNCNYNWNSGSDLDIHVVLSYEDFQKSCSSVDIEKMFKTKKELWNSEHDIDIKGIPTELYVQNAQQAVAKDDALFSLGQNKWIVVPRKIDNFDADQKAIDAIVNPISKAITDLIKSKSKDLNQIEVLKNIIISTRKTGLARNGQFGPENLAFKQLRNNGDIEKLQTYAKKIKDEELSL